MVNGCCEAIFRELLDLILLESFPYIDVLELQQRPARSLRGNSREILPRVSPAEEIMVWVSAIVREAVSGQLTLI